MPKFGGFIVVLLGKVRFLKMSPPFSCAESFFALPCVCACFKIDKFLTRMPLGVATSKNPTLPMALAKQLDEAVNMRFTKGFKYSVGRCKIHDGSLRLHE